MRSTTIAGKNFESYRAVAEHFKISYQTFISRLRMGWDPARAATEPVESPPRFTIDGVTRTIVEWAEQYGVSVASTYKRLQRGDDIITALTAERRCLKLAPHERVLNERARKAAALKKIRSVIRKYKDRPCIDCKGMYHSEAMEFDHVRGKKLFNLSRPPASLRRVAEEIAKCDLVCANCHRLRTKKRREGNRELS